MPPYLSPVLMKNGPSPKRGDHYLVNTKKLQERIACWNDQGLQSLQTQPPSVVDKQSTQTHLWQIWHRWVSGRRGSEFSAERSQPYLPIRLHRWHWPSCVLSLTTGRRVTVPCSRFTTYSQLQWPQTNLVKLLSILNSFPQDEQDLVMKSDIKFAPFFFNHYSW